MTKPTSTVNLTTMQPDENAKIIDDYKVTSKARWLVGGVVVLFVLLLCVFGYRYYQNVQIVNEVNNLIAEEEELLQQQEAPEDRASVNIHERIGTLNSYEATRMNETERMEALERLGEVE